MDTWRAQAAVLWASLVAQRCRKHKRHGFSPWGGKIPRRREWPPTPVLLVGESCRGACWATGHGVTESDTTDCSTSSCHVDALDDGSDAHHLTQFKHFWQECCPSHWSQGGAHSLSGSEFDCLLKAEGPDSSRVKNFLPSVSSRLCRHFSLCEDLPSPHQTIAHTMLSDSHWWSCLNRLFPWWMSNLPDYWDWQVSISRPTHPSGAPLWLPLTVPSWTP